MRHATDLTSVTVASTNQRSALGGLAVGMYSCICVFQPAISLKWSCCWTCIHVCVSQPAISLERSCWEDMYVMFVFYVEILYVTILSLI